MGSELNVDECAQMIGTLEVVDTSPLGADPAQPLDFSIVSWGMAQFSGHAGSRGHSGGLALRC